MEPGRAENTDVVLAFILEERAETPNDPSSATRPTGRVNCNHDAHAGFAAAYLGGMVRMLIFSVSEAPRRGQQMGWVSPNPRTPTRHIATEILTSSLAK